MSVSPFIRDPSQRRLSVLPWTVWAAAAFFILTASHITYGSLSLLRDPGAVGFATPESGAVWVIDPEPMSALIGVAVSAAVTIVGTGVGYMARMWGRRWLVIAALISMLVIPPLVAIVFIRDLGEALTSTAGMSPGAEIAGVLAIVWWLPAPILALIAGAELRVSRSRSSRRLLASGGPEPI